MRDLDGLEDIAEQSSHRVNESARKRGRGLFGWQVAPNIARAAAAREKPLPAPSPSPPKAVLEVHEREIVFGADVMTYNQLIDGIQARLGELGIRQVDFDMLAGLSDGMTGKAFGQSRVKRLGPEKLFDVIRAAGLKLRLEADPEQLAKMQKQIAENCVPRKTNQARMRNHSRPSENLINEILSYLSSRKGGIARLNAALHQARSHWARQGAKARNAKARPRFESIALSAVRALPPPDSRGGLDSYAEEEATAA